MRGMHRHRQGLERDFTSLVDLENGDSARILDIHGGLRCRTALMARGLAPGQYVEVLRTGRRSPVVLKLSGSQIIVGQGMAERVAVKLIS